MSTCEIAGTRVGYVLINCLLETSPWGLEWPESALFACAELVFKRRAERSPRGGPWTVIDSAGRRGVTSSGLRSSVGL